MPKLEVLKQQIICTPMFQSSVKLEGGGGVPGPLKLVQWFPKSPLRVKDSL